MKRASFYGIGVTTIFYVSLGCIGYAAFGNAAPGNVLTGFDEPFWLVNVANVAVVVHLVGAYQVIFESYICNCSRAPRVTHFSGRMLSTLAGSSFA